MNYEPLFKKLGYKFKDLSLLQRSLLHRSKSGEENYERLEFLGDRILGFLIAKKLYTEFPEDEEGKLARRFTSLVRQETLAAISRELELPKYIQLSYGEEKAGGREKDSVLSDCCESLIAAMYLDGGLTPVEKLIESFWDSYFHEPASEHKDPRSLLQEIAQKNGKNLPEYSVIEVSGSEHEPLYVMQVYVEGYEPVKAEGTSKKAAAKAAAENLLSIILKDD